MTQEVVLTKEKILNTAFALFIKDGYENTSIQAIIDAVGIAKGTFYHHYSSKESMLEELVIGLTKRIVAELEVVVNAPDKNSLEKMLGVFEGSAMIKMGKVAESVVLMRQMRTGANQRFVENIRKITTELVMPIFTRLVVEGTREGVFRVGHPEETANLLIGFGFGIQDHGAELFLKAVDGDDKDLERLINLFKAVEEAYGRILGIEDSAFHIYDWNVLRKAVREVRHDQRQSS